MDKALSHILYLSPISNIKMAEPNLVWNKAENKFSLN